jgi:hypothetical protein
MIIRLNFKRSKVTFFNRTKEQSIDQKLRFSIDQKNDHEIESVLVFLDFRSIEKISTYNFDH